MRFFYFFREVTCSFFDSKSLCICLKICFSRRLLIGLRPSTVPQEERIMSLIINSLCRSRFLTFDTLSINYFYFSFVSRQVLLSSSYFSRRILFVLRLSGAHSTASNRENLQKSRHASYCTLGIFRFVFFWKWKVFVRTLSHNLSERKNVF